MKNETGLPVFGQHLPTHFFHIGDIHRFGEQNNLFTEFFIWMLGDHERLGQMLV